MHTHQLGNITFSKMTHRIIKLIIIAKLSQFYCHVVSVILLIIFMLRIDMLSVAMLFIVKMSIVMLPPVVLSLGLPQLTRYLA
jgi:hypothetical protein